MFLVLRQLNTPETKIDNTVFKQCLKEIYVSKKVPVYVPTAVPQYKDNTKEAPTTTQHEHEDTIKEVVDPGKTYGSLQINLDKVDAFRK